MKEGARGLIDHLGDMVIVVTDRIWHEGGFGLEKKVVCFGDNYQVLFFQKTYGKIHV